MNTATNTASALSTKDLRSFSSILRALGRGVSFAAATRDVHPDMAALVTAWLEERAAARRAA